MSQAQGQIVITADTGQAEQGLQALKSRTDAAGSSAQGAGRGFDGMKASLGKATVAVGVAVAAINQLNAAAQRMASVAEDNDRAMARAARGAAEFGVSNDQARARLDRLATSLQASTRFAGGDVLAAFGNLQVQTRELGLSFEELERVTRLAGDVAEAEGISIEQASNRIAQALNGSTRAMRELGITAEDTQGALNQLEREFGGTAAATDSLSAFTDSLANRLGDAQDELGRTIQSSESYREALQNLNNLKVDLLESINSVVKAYDAFNRVIGFSVGEVNGYELSLRNVNRTIRESLSPTHLLRGAWQSGADVLGYFRPEVQELSKDVEELAKQFIDAEAAVKDFEEALKDLDAIMADQDLANRRRSNERTKLEAERREAEQRRRAAERRAEEERRAALRAEQDLIREQLALESRVTREFMEQIAARQAGVERLESIRRSNMAEEERRQQLLRDLRLSSFEEEVNLQDELQAAHMAMLSSTTERERQEIAERIEMLYEFERVRAEIRMEADELELADLNKQKAERERLHSEELEEKLRKEQEMAKMIEETRSQEEAFMTSYVHRMVGVYAGASRAEARERRRALGSSMMAEGLSNIISAPIRALLMTPQAGKISAATGAAQLAFGRVLGGSLGARGGGGGGGGGGGPAVSAPQQQAAQTTVNETSTVNYNIGMVGDPREFSLRQRQADQRGARLGQRGM